MLVISENEPRPDMRRCTRTTKAGERCRSGRLLWPRNAPLPDPMSCLGHLNESERVIHEEDRMRSEVEFGLMFDLWWVRLINSDPACWSWPLPAGVEMAEWQAGRCAICGHADVLVTDHDHRTGWVRGLLCRSCNTLEGCGHGGVFRKYREFNPASICGVQERYWNPFTKEFAEPAPPPHDPWKDNPMKGIGL